MGHIILASVPSVSWTGLKHLQSEGLEVESDRSIFFKREFNLREDEKRRKLTLLKGKTKL